MKSKQILNSETPWVLAKGLWTWVCELLLEDPPGVWEGPQGPLTDMAEPETSFPLGFLAASVFLVTWG